MKNLRLKMFPSCCKLIGLALVAILPTDAHSLGAVSRACTRLELVARGVLAGQGPSGAIIPGVATAVFGNCNVFSTSCTTLESITTDYGNRHNWLWATSQTYFRQRPVPNVPTVGYFIRDTIYASGWKYEPSDSVDYFFYRARAGIGNVPWTIFTDLRTDFEYAVIGEHKYINTRQCRHELM